MSGDEELVKRLRGLSNNDSNIKSNYIGLTMIQAADAIEELSKRIDRAVELYNRGVEKSALYEALVGIAPAPPKDEAPAGPYDLLYEEGGTNTT